MRRRFFTRITDENGEVLTPAPTVRVLKPGAYVLSSVTVPAGGLNTVEVDHPGAIAFNMAVLSVDPANGSITDPLTVVANPAFNGTAWDVTLLNNTGSDINVIGGSRLVLHQTYAAWFPSDSSTTGLTVAVPVSSTTGELSFYTDELDVDLQIIWGTDTLYQIDLPSDGRDYITPEHFGAVPDGITDCTVALQKCIDYAQRSNTKRIVLAAGTYKITTSLVFPSGSENIEIHGEGWGTSLWLDDTSAGSVIFSGSAFDGLYIHNLRLHMPNANAGFTTHGIRKGTGYVATGIVVDRVLFEGMKVGLSLVDADEIVVSNCVFKCAGDGSSDNEGSCELLGCTDARIVNSIFKGDSIDQSAVGVRLEPSEARQQSDITVQGNMFGDASANTFVQAAIHIVTANAYAGSRRLIIADNDIKNTPLGVEIEDDPSSAYQCRGFSLRNNSMTDVIRALASEWLDPEDLFITGNVVRDTSATSLQLAYTSGTSVIKNAVISNNICRGIPAGAFGIYVGGFSGIENVLITNNLLITEGSGGNPFFVDTSSSNANITITNNDGDFAPFFAGSLLSTYMAYDWLTMYGNFWQPPSQYKTTALDATGGVVNYTVSDSDHVINCTCGANDVNIDIPLSTQFNARELIIGKEDSGAGEVRLSRTGTDLVAGQTIFSISDEHVYIRLIAVSGVGWVTPGYFQSPRGYDQVGVGSNNRIIAGAGTPNGSVAGNVGDIYLEVSGSASNVLWVKETGLGTNTGWIGK